MASGYCPLDTIVRVRKLPSTLPKKTYSVSVVGWGIIGVVENLPPTPLWKWIVAGLALKGTTNDLSEAVRQILRRSD